VHERVVHIPGSVQKLPREVAVKTLIVMNRSTT
jgi:hypothetical protein